MAANEITMTLLQAEIILDRLAVPDALAEALTEHAEGEAPATPWSYDEIDRAANLMYADLFGRRKKAEYAGRNSVYFKLYDNVEIDVFVDCVEGSTYICKAEDEVTFGGKTPAYLRRVKENAKKLVLKMEKAGIRTSGFPDA